MKKDPQLQKARQLADDVARAMRHYPYLLRSVPPQLLDIDVVFSKVPFVSSFRLTATNPRDEGGAQSGPSL